MNAFFVIFQRLILKYATCETLFCIENTLLKKRTIKPSYPSLPKAPILLIVLYVKPPLAH